MNELIRVNNIIDRCNHKKDDTCYLEYAFIHLDICVEQAEMILDCLEESFKMSDYVIGLRPSSRRSDYVYGAIASKNINVINYCKLVLV